MDYTDFLVDRAQHMRPLEYDLSEKYNELLRYLNDLGGLTNIPVGVLGPADILSASDALDVPLRSLVVGGNSVQDGTPTPDAPVDIVSAENPVVTFAGKNLLDPSTLSNGYITNNGTVYGSTSTYKHNDYLPVSEGITYRVSQGGAEFGAIRTAFYDKEKQFISAASQNNFSAPTFVAPANAAYMRSSFNGSHAAEAMIEVATDTWDGYEPYQGTTVTLPVTLRSLPDGTRDTLALTYLRPSTREGWAWYAREVVRATDVVDLGSLAWSMYTIGGNRIFRAPYVTPSSSALCTALGVVTNSPSTMADNAINPHTGYWSANGHIAARADAYESAADFKAAMSGVMLQYKLATPTTETLDPIELPSVIGPSCTVYATVDATPQLTAQYVRDLSAAINDMQEAIADL